LFCSIQYDLFLLKYELVIQCLNPYYREVHLEHLSAKYFFPYRHHKLRCRLFSYNMKTIIHIIRNHKYYASERSNKLTFLRKIKSSSVTNERVPPFVIAW